MPVSIVIGGQFGSEGKGKTALEIVRRSEEPVVAVRVGGPNSGHTAYDLLGEKHILRQLPAACIDKNVDVVLPAGSYIDVDVLLEEIRRLDYPRDRIRISSYARIVQPEHREWEKGAGLTGSIGSTGSGVGGAVMASVARGAANFHLPSQAAFEDARLKSFIENDTSHWLRRHIEKGNRVVIEGTQGFGLSLLESGYWPKVTSRSTTAAGAVAEAGLSPIDVDDITMVVRSFPIRVAGDSGPLTGETTWEAIAWRAGRRDDLREYTTVTKRLRRVAHFDPDIVRRALDANRPTRLVLNHLDYIGRPQDLTDRRSVLGKFILQTEKGIGRRVDWFGFSGSSVIERVMHRHGRHQSRQWAGA